MSLSLGATESIPFAIIKGTKTGISTTSSQLTTTSTPIYKSITIKVRSIGAGTYIAIGDSSSQPYRLLANGDSVGIDTIDNVNKIYCITDIGSSGILEYFGG